MARSEEDMNQLEKDIRQLKIEYEQYFGGGRSASTELEWRIDVTMKRYSDRGPQMNFAHASATAIWRRCIRSIAKFSQADETKRGKAACSGTLARRRGRLRICGKQKQAAESASGLAVIPFAISCQDPDTKGKSGRPYAAFRHAKEQAAKKRAGLRSKPFSSSCARRPVISETAEAREVRSSSSPSRASTRVQGAR